MRGKNIRLFPFVDMGVDIGRNEFLQGAAGVVVFGSEKHGCIYPYQSAVRNWSALTAGKNTDRESHPTGPASVSGLAARTRNGGLPVTTPSGGWRDPS